jgi:hypothetical protein
MKMPLLKQWRPLLLPTTATRTMGMLQVPQQSRVAGNLLETRHATLPLHRNRQP